MIILSFCLLFNWLVSKSVSLLGKLRFLQSTVLIARECKKMFMH